MKSNGVCPWCLAVQVHCRCSIWGHRPNSFCVVRHEVRTDHLSDRELHYVVLHSNPWVVTSQGNDREFVAWSVCNRVQGGQTVTCGCFLGIPFFFGYSTFSQWNITTLSSMLYNWCKKNNKFFSYTLIDYECKKSNLATMACYNNWSNLRLHHVIYNTNLWPKL